MALREYRNDLFVCRKARASSIRFPSAVSKMRPGVNDRFAESISPPTVPIWAHSADRQPGFVPRGRLNAAPEWLYGSPSVPICAGFAGRNLGSNYGYVPALP